MIWPGTGDPYKRKKAIKFLLISAAIGGIAVLLTTVGVNPMIAKQAHNACIDDMDTDWKISFTFEMIFSNPYSYHQYMHYVLVWLSLDLLRLL